MIDCNVHLKSPKFMGERNIYMDFIASKWCALKEERLNSFFLSEIERYANI